MKIHLVSCALAVATCVGTVSATPVSRDAALEHARQLLQESILIDGHNDLPWALRNDPQARGDVAAYDLRRRTRGQTDIERLRQGRVGGQFWSVYVPSELTEGFARTQLEQIDLARRVIERYPEALQLASTAAEVRAAHKRGRIASLLGMEGGHAIENSLGALRAYYDLGVRYMTLTHNTHTDWADSATEKLARHQGLSLFGEDVVREMNRLGMLVDLSHTSPETMADALRVTRAPVIFSHSAARALCDVPRNVPDEILRELPKNGGVVMVAFVTPFVDQDVANITDPLIRDIVERARTVKSEAEVAALYKDAFANIKLPPTPIAKVADHIEHIRKVAGVEHVGIGSDFDGNDYWPQGLEDVSGYPRLFAELIRRGWSDRELKMLAGENVLRAMERAEAVAAEMQANPSTTFVPQTDCNSLPAGSVEYSTEGISNASDAPNQLSKQERGENWRLLFDGKSLKGWSGFQQSTIPSAWRVEEAALALPKFSGGEPPPGERGYIRTADAFENFELRLQWAVAPGGNSGIFFFVRKDVENRIWMVAPEMQILDDARHEDGIETSHRAGGLYDVYPPKCNALLPAGQYNNVRLVVNRGRVEHWLNGYRVAEYELDSPDWRARVAKSKFADMKEFGKVHEGYLALQDHGDVIRFRNIRIREL